MADVMTLVDAASNRTAAERMHSNSWNLRKGLSALGWMSAAQFICLGIRLGSSLALARLLSPTAYGILSPALAVLVTLEWFTDLGVRPSLIRHAHGGTLAYVRTGWWIDLARGAAIGLLTLVLAWPLSEFLGLPTLGQVLAVFSMYPVLLALRSPGLVIARRELNFGALVINEVVQTLGGTVATILIAWFYPTVWAMVGGMFVGAASGIVHSYMVHPIKPVFTWDRLVASNILQGSRGIFINTLLMALWLNSERLLGLRLVDVEQMGLYAVALNLAGVLDALIGRACEVYFSVLARTDDPIQCGLQHDRLCLRLALLLMPVLAIIAVLAPRVVSMLYDPRYLGSGILLAVMIVRLMLRSLGQVQFQYFLAKSEIRSSTIAYGAALALQLSLIWPLAQVWGALGLALASFASTAVHLLTQTLLAWKQCKGPLLPCAITFAWALLASALLLLSF